MTRLKICAATCASTADNGSSSKYISALLYNARAKHTRWRCPPDRLIPYEKQRNRLFYGWSIYVLFHQSQFDLLQEAYLNKNHRIFNRFHRNSNQDLVSKHMLQSLDRTISYQNFVQKVYSLGKLHWSTKLFDMYTQCFHWSLHDHILYSFHRVAMLEYYFCQIQPYQQLQQENQVELQD